MVAIALTVDFTENGESNLPSGGPVVHRDAPNKSELQGMKFAELLFNCYNYYMYR
jgi:hypothetical protein